MPGAFIDDVHIFKCGKRPDGTAIMCSEILFDVKVPFPIPENAPNETGWQEPGQEDVHIPLAALIQALRSQGVPVTFDEDEWERIRAARAEPSR
ncbi:hypothetical protein [Actinoplanes sp. G11-F43]|uniref:hypothetical protein n=1 Tax=Actinoplanes sp. G11-F43 TaxID=3424130 RepID=UPI003D32D6F7